MLKHNPGNERIKRIYFTYLKEAKRQSEQSVDAVAKALARFEEYTHFKSFKAFHHQQAIAFKNHLAKQKGQRSGELLSKATLHSTLSALQRFFFWLAGQPGYKSQFTYTDADFFNISGNDVRIATAQREQRSPTMEQVKHVIARMPCATEIERRNRALLAFTLLTGARVSAMASMKLQHIDFAQDCVHQDARQVNTKFRKTFTTFFLPVGEEVRGIVEDWVQYLQKEKFWGNDDPLFPKTCVKRGAALLYEVVGLDRKHWKGTSTICKIFREAFEGAGLKYYHPHSFRHTLVRLGQTTCKTPEDFMAWAQNIGHDGVLTAFFSYGEVACQRQGEIIRGLATPQQAVQSGADEFADAVLKKLRGSGVDV